jgi:hypothetical protein
MGGGGQPLGRTASIRLVGGALARMNSFGLGSARFVESPQAALHPRRLPKTLAQGPLRLSRYLGHVRAATSTTPRECRPIWPDPLGLRPHRCRGIRRDHTSVRGSTPVGDRPLHAHDGVADIRRLPLRDVWVRLHHRNSDVAGESGWKRHHLPEVLHEEPRHRERMPDLWPCPPASPNGEPLASLELAIGSDTVRRG